MGKQLAITAENFTPRNLPDGYTQVEYIESSGSQYIDTGFAPNQDTRVVADVSVSSSQSDEGHIASCTGGGYYFTLYVSSSSAFGTRYGTQALKTVGSTITAEERYILDKNKNVTTIPGTSVTHTAETFQMAYNLTLLCRNAAGTKARYISGKLYFCQIYDNGTLVRDYVPCTNASGVAGLYDLVNGTFNADAAGGTFTAGAAYGLSHLVGKKLYLTDDSLVYRKAKKAYLTVPNFAKRDLPDGYTQVEYIESSGTQYIDTGFKPTYQSRVVMDISDIGDTTPQFMFGSRNASSSSASQAFVALKRTTANVTSDYFGTRVNASVSDTTVRTTIDKNANVTTMYGKTITNTAVASGTSDYNLYLLAVNNVGTADYFCSAKLYGCRVYDNGTLVRDYVPCTNASGVAGLYDVVNGVFSADAAGGTFAAGATYMLIHRLCFSGSADVATMGITYTGNMTDAGVVTMSDGDYRLLTLTSSGTLTVDEDVNAEVWMCGGGNGGAVGTSGDGGAGGYTVTETVNLTGSMVAVIGSGGTSNRAGGISSFGNVQTTAMSAGKNGGTGGGGGGYSSSTGGTGDGVTKYPFGDSTYFSGKPHCAGGGGGARYQVAGVSPPYTIERYAGGQGGTNGGNGAAAVSSLSNTPSGGSGGSYGGGSGGSIVLTSEVNPRAGSAATFYGSGGGGGSYTVRLGGSSDYELGGAGYQGVIYIRIPVEQSGGNVTPATFSFIIDKV